MRPAFLCTFLVFILTTSNGQGLSFYKENITMRIEQGYFHVTGIYYLKSNGKTSDVLVYPYPVDSLYGSVDSITIFNLATQQVVKPLKTDPYKTVFTLDFIQTADQAIQISYRQKLLGNRAEYILKSTLSWRKPLEQAGYQLIVPSGIRITRFSLPPQDSIVTPREVVYLWDKQNYLPVENLVFEYRNK